MKALILNSGMGRRMGVLASEHPKCMTEISASDTILSRQLRLLCEYGVTEVVVTTGAFDDVLVAYCNSLALPVHLTFVRNPDYAATNYIYSIYCAREALRGDDMLILHGDLVFEGDVLSRAIDFSGSCVAVSSTAPLPEKDFKAVLQDGRVTSVGVRFFTDAVAAQPLYRLTRDDWEKWLSEIARFCERGDTSCYAEDALNAIAGGMDIRPLDVFDALCGEIDTPEDLAVIRRKVAEVENRTVYMCFSADMVHRGHIDIIRKAARLGKVTVGVLTDNAVASYKRFPLMPYSERKVLFENIRGVSRVIEQDTLSYAANLRALRPTYVVHGDDWREGVQKPIRAEVVSVLAEYGGRLVEFPYNRDDALGTLESDARARLSMPDMRRARLRKLLAMKPTLRVIEAHSGLTGLLAEKTVFSEDGGVRQFDAMWVSSLCDATAKGKPDIELVDLSSRLRTIDEIMEVTTKPIILDGDTGGKIEHFAYNVRTLERVGVSAVIIEDKTGLKMNSLFGTEVPQSQDDIESFCRKISAGKRAQKTTDFMIIARIESLILERGQADALARARAYVAAGADGIMIHSRAKTPDEVYAFCDAFRAEDASTPIVVVPTAYAQATEEELSAHGVNVVIYANHLIRSAFPAMQQAALSILRHHRALEAGKICMPIREILTLIPVE